jgi:hypothetical protein
MTMKFKKTHSVSNVLMLPWIAFLAMLGSLFLSLYKDRIIERNAVAVKKVLVWKIIIVALIMSPVAFQWLELQIVQPFPISYPLRATD